MDSRSVLCPTLVLSLAIALAGCEDRPADEAARVPDGVPEGTAREARAAELFAPREALPLVGTRWQAEAAVLPGLGKAPLVSGLVYTIEFGEGGKRARGHDGCDAYERGYAHQDGALRLDPAEPVAPFGDAAPCEPGEIARIERSLVEALLGSAERAEVRGDRLDLVSPDGAVLTLRGEALGEIPAGVGPGLEPEFAPGEVVPFAVLERSDGANLGAREVSVPDRFVAVYDAQRFAALWRNAHSFDASFPVPDVRFDVGSVLAVFSPLRPSPGHSIEIAAIRAGGGGGPDDGPIVRVITTEPGAGCADVGAPTVPYEIVGVPTILAAPRFEETVTRGEPCG